jgi:hypothetical protein
MSINNTPQDCKWLIEMLTNKLILACLKVEREHLGLYNFKEGG